MNIHFPMWAKVTLYAILTPTVIVALLAIAIYLPPVQKWLVDRASEYASEETGMEICVDGVHLAFPLNLSVEGIKCLKNGNDNAVDTVALIHEAIVDVQLLPLFKGNVVINQVELNQAHFNTADMIDAARVKGYVGRLLIDNTPPPVATVALDSSVVRLSNIILVDSNIDVQLADSVPEDTTETKNTWKIYAQQFTVQNSQITVRLTTDSVTGKKPMIATTLSDVNAKDGFFDLDKGLYEVGQLTINSSQFTVHSSQLHANHIALSDINLKVDSIHYCDPDIRLLIREASLKEQSGLELKSMTAKVAIDSTKMTVDGYMATPASKMALNLKMHPNPVTSLDLDNGHIDAKIDASIGSKDILTLAKMGSKETGRMLKGLPHYPLSVKGEMHGNMRQMYLRQMSINMPTVLSAEGNGTISVTPNVTARLHTDVKTYNLNFVKSMLDRSTAQTINIPPLKASADIVYNDNGNIDIKMDAYEGRGTLTAKVRGNINRNDYDIEAKAKSLNVNHFVKGYNLSNVDATASLHGGRLMAEVNSHAGDVVGTFAVNGTMDKKITDLSVTTDLQRIDLYQLKITDSPLSIALNSKLAVKTDMNEYYEVRGMVSGISVTDTATTHFPDNIVLDVLTRRDTTAAKIDCGDFTMQMNAQGGYKWLMGCGDRMMAALEKQLKARTINQQDLRNYLPKMTLSLHSGQDNPIYRSLRFMDIDYSLVDLSLKTSRENGIFANLEMNGLKTQGYKLDTVSVEVESRNEPMEIYYRTHIRNRPPNDYVFDAYIDGKLLEHGVVTGVRLFDNKNELALRLGAEATMEENGIKLHFVPKNPTLGYDEFTLNENNYILLDKKNRIHAYIDLLAHDGTGLKVYSNLDDEEDEANDCLQDLTLSVNKLNIGRLLSSLPYAVNAQGILNGDFHVIQNKDESFTLSSDLDINKLTYEGCEIGNIGTQFTYLPKSDGSHYIDGIILKDDVQVGDINGSYNFNTDAINAKMNFEKFPLQMMNGFVPEQIIGLEGTAEGTLSIEGTTKKPKVNGELFLENAALLSVPYGVRLRFDDDPIRIQNSHLLFENFQMYAANDEPLLAHGTVEFEDLDHIKLNMRMRAKNFKLIDAKENSKSEAYGEMFVNFFAFINGELDKLKVKGKIDILPSTNLYYILRDSPITTDNQLKELVTFTDFENGDSISITRPTIDGMSMDFSIAVQEGAHIKCWLDGAHSNYLDLIGNGDLRYVYVNEETKLTGRYTITEGEMKYSLPVIPLKTFVIDDGSYLEWTGEMMNPRLHITAKETVKANVNVDGVNQMVTFRTGVILSKTLNDMGLEFTIEAPENQTVSDELNMKSTEERGKLAVTMLTTGMYLSDGNTSKFSMNSAMNSFLQSQINNIAGNALKTIDLSFGMESSTEQDGTMHNDYTFKFAKRFWNNRLSISVGGKVSSGPDVSGQNKSFFNDVELQYRLSDTSNKYLQMYYKRAVYDYLEGYLGEYGAGYLWKKKAQTLKGIFGKDPVYIPLRPVRQDSLKGSQVKEMKSSDEK